MFGKTDIDFFVQGGFQILQYSCIQSQMLFQYLYIHNPVKFLCELLEDQNSFYVLTTSFVETMFKMLSNPAFLLHCCK